jgi:hypothetical protein
VVCYRDLQSVVYHSHQTSLRWLARTNLFDAERLYPSCPRAGQSVLLRARREAYVSPWILQRSEDSEKHNSNARPKLADNSNHRSRHRLPGVSSGSASIRRFTARVVHLPSVANSMMSSVDQLWDVVMLGVLGPSTATSCKAVCTTYVGLYRRDCSME